MARIRALFTLAFWLDAAERAVKTFAQSLLGTITADTVGLFDIDWGDRLSVAGLMVVGSLLSSVASAKVDAVSPASALPAGLG